MIFSGPIVSRGSPSSGSPEREPAGEHVVEAVGVAGVADAQQVGALGPAGRPVGDAAAELQVDQPDHALRGRGVHRPAVGLGSGAVRPEDAREPAVGHEPLGLADHDVARRQGEHVERRGVEPAVVAVAGDQHDRLVGGDRVEVGDRRVVRPGGGPVPPADDRQVGPLLEPLADQRDGVGARPCRREVEPGGGQGPLAEVDVLVPEAGRQPAPARVVRRLVPAGREAGADLDDAPGLDTYVDGVGHVLGDGHQAGVADEHGATVGGRLPAADPRPGAPVGQTSPVAAT